ncbi:ion transporter [Roseofilum casamattae]|uniref:Ion transporter n=1 Tax=Roseofilum casamattae BLCC-M143 TaxID=3022442 RepID=A0ABT7C051_9CYAN|nr:ion transporter [Roseofilum casamattae]MDJ1184056.1 ion transporter [Roseofilum casamattae BLCC-M143]
MFSFSVRQTVNQCLGIETLSGRLVNLTIISLVIISSAIFVIQTYSLPEDIQHLLTLTNTCILIAFIVEYGLRLWCSENKINTFFSIYSIIDLFIFVPFILGLFDIGVGFSHNLSWFRILHLARFLRAKMFLGIIDSEKELVVTRIVFILCSIIFVYSGLIYQIEHSINNPSFRTFFDALYFSVVTMTTVGFGDITPLSEPGRWITLAMILTGIALIPWQISELIKHFVREAQKANTKCPSCGLSVHDLDANFCKLCGANLASKESS